MDTKLLKPILIIGLIVPVLAACSTGASSTNKPEAGKAQVDHVEVQIGVGSPIPVHVLISGSLPDTCAQFSDIEQSFENLEFRIQIGVETTRVAGVDCHPDSVPFSLNIPLNMVNQPAGEYKVIANDVSTSFIWPVSMSDTTDTPEDATGSINGWVWHDLCASGMDGQPGPTSPPPGCVAQDSVLGPYHADGVMAPDELPIGGVVVSLGKGACPSTGFAETTTIVSDLSYSFVGLDAGIYCVSIDPHKAPNLDILLPGEWTYPAVNDGVMSVTVDLKAGENKFDINFGWDHQFQPDSK